MPRSVGQAASLPFQIAGKLPAPLAGGMCGEGGNVPVGAGLRPALAHRTDRDDCGWPLRMRKNCYARRGLTLRRIQLIAK